MCDRRRDEVIGISTEARTHVGVTADIADERGRTQGVMTVYNPFEQKLGSRYSCIRAAIRTRCAQITGRFASWLRSGGRNGRDVDDVRGAEVLAAGSPNAIVFGACQRSRSHLDRRRRRRAAILGERRTREFGIRPRGSRLRSEARF